MQRRLAAGFVLLIGVVIMSWLGALLLAHAGDRDPVGVARDYMQGMAARDPQRVANALCEAPVGSPLLFNDYAPVMADVQVTERAHSGARAEIDVRGWLDDGPFVWRLRLQRVGGTWCVREMVNESALALR